MMDNSTRVARRFRLNLPIHMPPKLSRTHNNITPIVALLIWLCTPLVESKPVKSGHADEKSARRGRAATSTAYIELYVGFIEHVDELC
jgi:hypothetical protein